MQKWKEALQSGFLLIGVIYILTLLLSIILKEPEILSEQKESYLLFFIIIVVGKYIILKIKK